MNRHGGWLARVGLVCVVALGAAAARAAGEERTAATAPAPKPTTQRGGPVKAPERRNVPGKRIKLKYSDVFIPDYYRQEGDTVIGVVHFLGEPWCVEQSFYDARRNAILLCSSGAANTLGYAQAKTLHVLLDEASAALKEQGVVTVPINRVALSAFSGGYGNVLKILRHKEWAESVSDLVLGDALYASKDPKTGEMSKETIRPFIEFAQRAAEGKTSMVFSHLFPPEVQYRGNTTTITATWLVEECGATKADGAGAKNSSGATLGYRADKQGLHILGYYGMTNQDHADHLYAIGDLLKLTSIPEAKRH